MSCKKAIRCNRVHPFVGLASLPIVPPRLTCVSLRGSDGTDWASAESDSKPVMEMDKTTALPQSRGQHSARLPILYDLPGLLSSLLQASLTHETIRNAIHVNNSSINTNTYETYRHSTEQNTSPLLSLATPSRDFLASALSPPPSMTSARVSFHTIT